MTSSALIIEDHPIYRDALCNFLLSILERTHIISSSSVEEALKITADINDIKIVLIDLGLPGLKGVEAIHTIKHRWPETTVVVISASEDRRAIMSALHAGAKVALSKALSNEAIFEVISNVLNNNPIQEGWITTSGRHNAGENVEFSLTPRQQEIVTLLDQGLSNKEICLRLGLAETTVKMHMSLIFRALKVNNRTQAILVARQLGIAKAFTQYF
ncbi:response regulator [Undibacterium sp. Di27W]|uniref:response regulator n=1 Tax=Undibacterium sp. Di27W TaxID=3413036 RepID=UPI003BF35F20